MNMYKNIKLDRGLYSITGKNFTQALAALDPDAEYKGTDMEQLDAFERQLKRFDIKIAGEGCDRVEKFFTSTESAVLFPEYVRRQIKSGMDSVSLVQYAAAVTYTDSVDFRALSVTSAGSETGVAQLAAMPATTVKLADTASALTKFARRLDCSYESVRKQRLEAFGVILRSLGAQLSRAVNKKMTDVIYTSSTKTKYTGTVTYAQLAAFWASMSSCDMDVMLCNPAMMANILALDEMKLCVSDFMSSGKAVTPYGITLVKCPWLKAGTAIGMDSSCGVEAIFGTDVIIDTDKLISTQCDEIAASVMCGFSVLTADSVKTLEQS